MGFWKLLFGVLLLGFGVFFILSLTGLLPENLADIVNTYWPMGIVAFGFLLFVDGMFKGKTAKSRFNRGFFAASVMTVGSIVQASQLDIIKTENGNVNLWAVALALLLIYIGLRIMFFRKSRITFTIDDLPGSVKIHNHDKSKCCGSDDWEDCECDEDEAGNVKNGVTIGGDKFIGELNIGAAPWAPESGSYNVNVGELSIDFTTAMLKDGETIIDMTGWVGEIQIKVPADMAIDVYAITNVGEVNFKGIETRSGISKNELRFKSPDYNEALKKLKIRAKLNIGEISLTRV